MQEWTAKTQAGRWPASSKCAVLSSTGCKIILAAAHPLQDIQLMDYNSAVHCWQGWSTLNCCSPCSSALPCLAWPGPLPPSPALPPPSDQRHYPCAPQQQRQAQPGWCSTLRRSEQEGSAGWCQHLLRLLLLW